MKTAIALPEAIKLTTDKVTGLIVDHAKDTADRLLKSETGKLSFSVVVKLVLVNQNLSWVAKFRCSEQITDETEIESIDLNQGTLALEEKPHHD